MTLTTDLHDFLRTRRSVRRFRPDPVPEAVVERVLTTATYAPSAHNRQPWRFVVISSSEVKSRLASRMAADFERDLIRDGTSSEEIQRLVERSTSRLESAPLVVVICLDTDQVNSHPDPARQLAEHTMAAQSVSAAGLQLLLAAHAEGLGGVWVCSPLFTPLTVGEALGLQVEWEPQGMFYLGFAADVPNVRARTALAEISRFL